MAPKPSSRPRRPARPRAERVASLAAVPAPAPPPAPVYGPREHPVTDRGRQLDAAYAVLDADLDRIWGEYHAAQAAAWTAAQGRMEDAARHYAATVATIRGPW